MVQYSAVQLLTVEMQILFAKRSSLMRSRVTSRAITNVWGVGVHAVHGSIHLQYMGSSHPFHIPHNFCRSVASLLVWLFGGMHIKTRSTGDGSRPTKNVVGCGGWGSPPPSKWEGRWGARQNLMLDSNAFVGRLRKDGAEYIATEITSALPNKTAKFLSDKVENFADTTLPGSVEARTAEPNNASPRT